MTREHLRGLLPFSKSRFSESGMWGEGEESAPQGALKTGSRKAKGNNCPTLPDCQGVETSLIGPSLAAALSSGRAIRSSAPVTGQAAEGRETCESLVIAAPRRLGVLRG